MELLEIQFARRGLLGCIRGNVGPFVEAIDNKMKKILLTFFALFGIVQAQPTLTPVMELGVGSNIFFNNKVGDEGFGVHPSYRLNMEVGLGIDKEQSLFLPSLGVMIDETQSTHVYSGTEILKTFFLIYGGIDYERRIGEKWTFGLKGALGFGKICDWQLHKSGTASGTKTSSGRTIEEEMRMMEEGGTRVASIFLGVGYRMTHRIKLKTELFFSLAHDMYEGNAWFYSDLRSKVAGITLSIQYIWSH